MRRTLGALLAGATLVAVPTIDPEPAEAAGRDRVVRCKGPGCTPAAFAFTPDGSTIFYAERLSGEIRRHNLAGGKDGRFAKIPDVSRQGEQGVLGIAVDPDWNDGPKQRWIYVYYTEDNPHRNVIVRLRRRGSGSAPAALGRRRRGVQRDRLLSMRAADYHDGGVLHFGPDEKLYVVTGDTQQPGLAQKRRSPAGKVLRLEQTGKRPSDNPIGRSKAFSYGHRNSFGFAFDPATGSLWQTENGPECDDEVNLVTGGRNYGWGGASRCPDTNDSGPNPEPPKAKFNPVPALTGAAFCSTCGLAADVDGDLLIGSYLDGKIRNLTLNPARDDVADVQVLYDHPSAVLAVEAAPDGTIYFSDFRAIYRLR